jgi:hypothetical protein
MNSARAADCSSGHVTSRDDRPIGRSHVISECQILRIRED